MRRSTRNSRKMRFTTLLEWMGIVVALSLVFAGSSSAAPPGSADLTISKTASATSVELGSKITYEVEVSNLGPDLATDVTVTDQLPKGTDFFSATTTVGKCTAGGNKVSCKLGDLAVNSPTADTSVSLTIVVTTRKSGTVTNVVTAKSDQKDPVAKNNKASAKTTVLAPPTTPTCRGVPATIVGTGTADRLEGTGGRDVVVSFGGADSVVTFSGRDLVCAGKGNDSVQSGPDADRVLGSGGSDHLVGRGGADNLSGNTGNDTLKGNRGNDRLRGGFGFDRCRGGAGADLLSSCEI